MTRWIPYAFVRIVFFFMLGICAAIYYPEVLDLFYASITFLVFVAGYGIITFCFWQKRFRLSGAFLKFLAGFMGLTAIFLAGFINVLICTDTRKQNHLVHIKSTVAFSKVIITGGLVEKANSWKVEAIVNAIQASGHWQECDSKILLYFPKKAFPEPFTYGDVLLLKGQPQAIAGPSNPEEFDYRRFMRFKNIYHQQFVRADDVKHIGFEPPSWVEYYALICRRWADDALKNNISGEREQGLASGLVLGITDGLDNELLSAYKATGSMHVLAVSGLHVAILYGLLLFILKPLNKVKSGPWVAAIISIFVLWAYAFVTGLSPSVLRAVTMFSFVALARPAGHRTNIYNTLAVSAFCILLYDPYLLMSVGFQLSYLAVLGIVYIHPRLYNLYEPANRLLDEVWKISSVSIAAQLATFSLGVLYFHQFPNYFLVSNLFVIPASFAVLVLGLMILAFGVIQPLASVLGFILEWIIKILNVIVFAIEDLPFSLMENLYITNIQCFLIISILIAILLLLETRKFKWVIFTVVLAMVFSFVQWHHYDQNINIQKVTVYHVNGHSAIDFVDRGQAYFIADSALRTDANKIDFHITPHRVKVGVGKRINSTEAFEQQLTGCRLMVWKGKTFLQIYDSQHSLPVELKVNYVIVSNNAVTNLPQFVKQIRMDTLILDSSNSRLVASKFLKQTKDSRYKIYSVLHEGAFEQQI